MNFIQSELEFFSSASDADSAEDTECAFDSQRRKCGKWSKEEQAFANRLIDDFYRGVSQGVENGQTLRTHLAQKLRCDPLRISKRFAGSNSLGKVTNVSKVFSFINIYIGLHIIHIMLIHFCSRASTNNFI